MQKYSFFHLHQSEKLQKDNRQDKDKNHSRKHSSLGNRQNTEIKRRFIFVKRRFSDCLKKTCRFVMREYMAEVGQFRQGLPLLCHCVWQPEF